jgi:hypothetical protein
MFCLDQLSLLLYPHQVEVKCSFCLWPPVLFGRGAICLPSVLDYVVPSRADDVSCSPGGVAVLLSSGTAQACSLFMNYDGSRMSQMLAELILQFSVFRFCKNGEKKPKKKK